ncbi:hypothetical protein [Tateyamaria omphalii]|uniref:hypothetical protein n=1 Tax=Tateyamaria omphalii TaxID=299262 RepID=UPI001E3017CC|nr:hypothetical protein [Tateyamaria omphalii]
MKHAPVAIIGGGIHQCSVAYRLAKASFCFNAGPYFHTGYAPGFLLHLSYMSDYVYAGASEAHAQVVRDLGAKAIRIDGDYAA